MQKFPTPKYKIDPEEGDNNVYPPSEDTFLFMDALEKERELIINLNPSLSLEIGSGSGVVTTFLHQILSSNLNKSSNLASSKLFSICTDLNNSALKCTKRTAAMNSIPIEFLDLINCNILDPLISRLKNSVDILLLNPPYVPTDEVNASKEEEYSYAGGIRGRNLLDKLLPIVSEILSPKGLFYLVALKENGVDELISHQETKRNFNLIGTKVIDRKCRNEHLFVLKFTKCIDEPLKQIISLPNTAHVGKIMLHLKPIGAAPQLKKEFTKYKCDANWTVFQFQQQILRKLLGLKPADSLFIFVKETFCPSPEHTFGDLYKCFGSESGGILYIQYSLTPAWG